MRLDEAELRAEVHDHVPALDASRVAQLHREHRGLLGIFVHVVCRGLTRRLLDA